MQVPQGHPAECDLLSFLKNAQTQIQHKLTEELLALRGIKFQFAVELELRKDASNGTDVLTVGVFRAKQIVLLQAHTIPQALHDAFPGLLRKLKNFTNESSGWVVRLVTKLLLDVARYQPLHGGSYLPLPAAVQSKKASTNVKNIDGDCLRWSLRAVLFPADNNPQRPSKYPTEDGLNFTRVSALTPLAQLDRVDQENHLAIHVYAWEDGGVVIYQFSRNEVDCGIKLFLVTKNVQHHYTWIKDINRLLYHQSKHTNRLYFCECCLHSFTREDLLEKHKPDCRGLNQAAVAIEMPKPGTDQIKIRFENDHEQLKAPYIIYVYAAFKTVIPKIQGPR